MSCLIEPPSGFCASDMSSRSFQNAARWSRFAAIAASSTMPASSPLARIASSVRAGVVARRRQLHQHVPGIPARQRIGGCRCRGAARNRPRCRPSVRSWSACRPASFCEIDSSFSAASRRLQADEGGLHRARLRKQLQHRRGDDAERALGADEQVAQIVAGIVLLQLRQQRSECARRPAPLRAPSASSRATP